MADDKKATIITDNWLLQNAAELLAKETDIGKETKLILFNKKTLQEKPIYLGAIQIECLASLLEQIVFYDSIFVMEGYTNTWKGKLDSLDRLLDEMIVEINPNHDKIQKSSKLYIDYLCREPAISRKHTESVADWEKVLSGYKGEDIDTFPNQVIGGTVGYLAISEVTDHIYCPHPTRLKFLENTLYSSFGKDKKNGGQVCR